VSSQLTTPHASPFFLNFDLGLTAQLRRPAELRLRDHQFISIGLFGCSCSQVCVELGTTLGVLVLASYRKLLCFFVGTKLLC
jgi:hypothetical protein